MGSSPPPIKKLKLIKVEPGLNCDDGEEEEEGGGSAAAAAVPAAGPSAPTTSFQQLPGEVATPATVKLENPIKVEIKAEPAEFDEFAHVKIEADEPTLPSTPTPTGENPLLIARVLDMIFNYTASALPGPQANLANFRLVCTQWSESAKPLVKPTFRWRLGANHREHDFAQLLSCSEEAGLGDEVGGKLRNFHIYHAAGAGAAAGSFQRGAALPPPTPPSPSPPLTMYFFTTYAHHIVDLKLSGFEIHYLTQFARFLVNLEHLLLYDIASSFRLFPDRDRFNAPIPSLKTLKLLPPLPRTQFCNLTGMWCNLERMSELLSGLCSLPPPEPGAGAGRAGAGSQLKCLEFYPGLCHSIFTQNDVIFGSLTTLKIKQSFGDDPLNTYEEHFNVQPLEDKDLEYIATKCLSLTSFSADISEQVEREGLARFLLELAPRIQKLELKLIPAKSLYRAVLPIQHPDMDVLEQPQRPPAPADQDSVLTDTDNENGGEENPATASANPDDEDTESAESDEANDEAESDDDDGDRTEQQPQPEQQPRPTRDGKRWALPAFPVLEKLTLDNWELDDFYLVMPNLEQLSLTLKYEWRFQFEPGQNVFTCPKVRSFKYFIATDEDCSRQFIDGNAIDYFGFIFPNLEEFTACFGYDENFRIIYARMPHLKRLHVAKGSRISDEAITGITMQELILSHRSPPCSCCLAETGGLHRRYRSIGDLKELQHFTCATPTLTHDALCYGLQKLPQLTYLRLRPYNYVFRSGVQVIEPVNVLLALEMFPALLKIDVNNTEDIENSSGPPPGGSGNQRPPAPAPAIGCGMFAEDIEFIKRTRPTLEIVYRDPYPMSALASPKRVLIRRGHFQLPQ